MTDTEIWDKEWFMELSPKHKCLIRYLFDKCDSSGMWKPNWKLATLHVGETVSFEDLKKIPSDQYEIIDGKIFLPDFIKFQYGKLSEASPAHKPIFQAIEKNNLSGRVFNRVSDTLQEKDKEKEEEKEPEEEKDFGKSENLFDPSALSPRMLAIWKQKNANYPEQTDEDFPALRKISQFICDQEGISYQPREPDCGKLVLANWERITEFVSEHKHFSSYNLNQVFRYRQNIVTEIKNGTSTSKNGSVAGKGKGTRSSVKQVFDSRYSQK